MVNEVAPHLMKALAEGIGVPVEALREKASRGKIASEVTVNALQADRFFFSVV